MLIIPKVMAPDQVERGSGSRVAGVMDFCVAPAVGSLNDRSTLTSSRIRYPSRASIEKLLRRPRSRCEIRGWSTLRCTAASFWVQPRRSITTAMRLAKCALICSTSASARSRSRNTLPEPAMIRSSSELTDAPPMLIFGHPQPAIDQLDVSLGCGYAVCRLLLEAVQRVHRV